MYSSALGCLFPNLNQCIGANSLWDIAYSFDYNRLGSPPNSTLESLQALFNAVLKQAVLDSTTERRQKFTESFTARALALLQQRKPSLIAVGLLSTAFLLKSWVSTACVAVDLPVVASPIPKLFYDVLMNDLKTITSKDFVVDEKKELQEMVIYRALAEFPHQAVQGPSGMDSTFPSYLRLGLFNILTVNRICPFGASPVPFKKLNGLPFSRRTEKTENITSLPRSSSRYIFMHELRIRNRADIASPMSTPPST
jgi:hypothetical protein